MHSIQIRNLNKTYQGLTVLKDFNIEFSLGQIHCLFGPSGCGKTTLLQLICGLQIPDAGEIRGVRNRSFSYVFQEERLLPWATVKENILFVLKNTRFNQHQAEQIAEKYLSLVDLSSFKHLYPNQLSGGMKQRVAIARAFAYQGDILLLDEPFKGLDFALKKRLMDYILSYWSEHQPLCLFVTHDAEEALYLADVIHFFSGPPLTLTHPRTLRIPRRDFPLNALEMARYKEIIQATCQDVPQNNA